MQIVGIYRPDVVGFSAITGTHHWSLDKASLIKVSFPKVRILFGGGHPTYFPEMIQHPSVDMIIRGEAEGAVQDLARCIDEGEGYSSVMNLWVKQGEEIVKNPVRPYLTNEELDTLPFADRDIYFAKYPYLAKRAVKSFIGQRGCPYSCRFCLNYRLKVIYKNKRAHLRRRSPSNLVLEMEEVRKRYALETVHILDEIFNIDREWCLSVMDQYARLIRVPYYCFIRADLMDREIARMLKESACAGVWIGMESGDESLRKNLLGKRLTDDQIINCAHLLHEAGIPFRMFCMIGLPGETIEQAFKTIELCIRVKTDYPWCAVYQPYSKTSLVEYCKRKGYLPSDFSVDEVDNSYYHDSPLVIPDKQLLMNLHKFFQTAVLFPWTFQLIKWLIRLPSNFLFKLWFALIYFPVHVRSEGHNLRDALLFAFRYVRILLFRK